MRSICCSNKFGSTSLGLFLNISQFGLAHEFLTIEHREKAFFVKLKQIQCSFKSLNRAFCHTSRPMDDRLECLDKLYFELNLLITF